MIRGDVVDPKLTLDNREIVRRHIRAFLLQNYHQDRIPEIDPNQRHDLFSVLGTVSEFRSGASILNRDDFAAWLKDHENYLRERVLSWMPKELSEDARADLVNQMKEDCLRAVDDAIRPGHGETDAENQPNEDTGAESAPEQDEERPQQASNPGKLLDRLLYCGKLPRYAFPTDVATFHVFDRDRSSRFSADHAFRAVPRPPSRLNAVRTGQTGLDFGQMLYVGRNLFGHVRRPPLGLGLKVYLHGMQRLRFCKDVSDRRGEP